MTDINAQLDGFEAEALCEILHLEILKHRTESRIENLCGEISDAELNWHQRHANFLEVITRKLFPGYRYPAPQRSSE